MIEQLYPHDVTSGAQLLGDLQVGTGRLKTAGRVVVCDDDRDCTVLDSGSEDLSRMHNICR